MLGQTLPGVTCRKVLEECTLGLIESLLLVIGLINLMRSESST